MKRSKLVGYGIALLAFVITSVPATVQAAACANVSSFGAVEMNIPTLPDAETHAIWVRMQVSSSSARILAETNGTECIEISGNMTPNQWSWQTYRQNGSVVPLNFPRKEGNKIKIIGVQAGVKVDRVLITRADCIPQELGDNCSDAANAVSATDDSSITLTPPSNNSVSGRVTISSTPGMYEFQLKELTYSVQGQVLQSSTDNQPFDTTLVANGKHTIAITTRLNNGQVIKEETIIDVDNPEHAFSAAFRWLRLHKGTVKTVGMAVAAIIVTLVLFSLLRLWYLEYRQRKFHGL